VYAHKSLMLFRSIEREMIFEVSYESEMKNLMRSKHVPEFFRSVYNL